MKKKNHLILALSGFGVISLVLTIANLGNGSFKIANGSINEVWNHYLRQAPGLQRRGIKEYWVSCTTHETMFTKPQSGTITDQGVPSQLFIDTLDPSDERLIKPIYRIYDFNDNVLPDIFEKVQNVSDLYVSDGALHASVTALDYGFTLKQEVLDALFSDSSVKSITFDAWSDDTTNNFRHRTNSTNVTYEGGHDDSGINGTPKTFVFDRSMYNSTKSGDAVFYGGGNFVPKTISIDNLKVSSRVGRNNQYYFDFDNGYLVANDNNYRLPGGTAVFAAIPNDASSHPSLTADAKAGGPSSLQVAKVNGWTSFFINQNSDMFKNMPENGILVDVRATADFNHKFGVRNYAGNALYEEGKGLDVTFGRDTWYTYHFVKGQDSMNGMTKDGRFFIFAGSTTGTIYIDNVRYVNNDVVGFEDGFAKYNGSYVTYSKSDFDNTDVGHSKLRDNSLYYDFIINTTRASSCGLDEEHVTEGAKSLKVTFDNTGYGNYHLNPFLAEYMDWDNYVIKMDVYSDGATFASSSLLGSVAPGKWTTITITKDKINISNPSDRSKFRLDHQAYRFEANNITTGSVWFDNLRVEHK